MKKMLGVAAVAALFATTAMAATVDVRVVTTGNVGTATAGANIPVFVQAQLSGGTQGLALIGFNIDVIPGSGAADADLCDTGGFLLMAPVAMQNFDRKNLSGPGFSNEGLTNPSDLDPGLSGYSGTCSAGKLLQLGGGQNTIGNTVGGAPYPIGGITTGVGNSGWTNIAQGSIDASSLTGAQTWTISVDTVFANTLNTGGPTPIAVTEATVGNIAGSLVISAGIVCPAWDVNCNGSVNAGDLLVITNPLNWLQANPPCDRADVNNDGSATAGDLLQVTNPVRWLTTHGACICTPNPTPGIAGCPS